VGKMKKKLFLMSTAIILGNLNAYATDVKGDEFEEVDLGSRRNLSTYTSEVKDDGNLDLLDIITLGLKTCSAALNEGIGFEHTEGELSKIVCKNPDIKVVAPAKCVGASQVTVRILGTTVDIVSGLVGTVNDIRNGISRSSQR
jgi:hypothetical protein